MLWGAGEKGVWVSCVLEGLREACIAHTWSVLGGCVQVCRPCDVDAHVGGVWDRKFGLQQHRRQTCHRTSNVVSDPCWSPRRA